VAPTIRDVARAVGVSQSTVSRALSMPELVNPATGVRVEAAARELGYRPNRAARELSTGRTGNIGLIVPDISNPFFSSVVNGVQAAARAADHAVFIADTDEEAAAETDLLRALSAQVDGTILCSPRLPDAELAEIGQGSTVVLTNRRAAGRSSVTGARSRADQRGGVRRHRDVGHDPPRADDRVGPEAGGGAGHRRPPALDAR
jgi:LacI family transcriptional regulator